MVQMHLWWKESNFLKSFLRGVQHSNPYNRTEWTHAWYTMCFVSTLKSLLLLNADLLSAPKDLDAFALF